MILVVELDARAKSLAWMTDEAEGVESIPPLPLNARWQELLELLSPEFQEAVAGHDKKASDHLPLHVLGQAAELGHRLGQKDTHAVWARRNEDGPWKSERALRWAASDCSRLEEWRRETSALPQVKKDLRSAIAGNPCTRLYKAWSQGSLGVSSRGETDGFQGATEVWHHSEYAGGFATLSAFLAWIDGYAAERTRDLEEKAAKALGLPIETVQGAKGFALEALWRASYEAKNPPPSKR